MLRFVATLAFSACLPVAAAAQTGMRWDYIPSIAADPMRTHLVLIRGAPRSDALQMLATCTIGANWIYADVLLRADVADASEGDPVSVTVRGNRRDLNFDATVYGMESGLRGVRVAVPLDDPFWEVLSGPGPVVYGVPGHETHELGTDGARSPILAFRNDCEHIDVLRPPRSKR